MEPPASNEVEKFGNLALPSIDTPRRYWDPLFPNVWFTDEYVGSVFPPKSTKACERAGGSTHVSVVAAPRVRSDSSLEPHADAARANEARIAKDLETLDTSTIIPSIDGELHSKRRCDPRQRRFRG